MVDYCRFRSGLRCYRGLHCGVFDRASGNVGCRELKPNPSAWFLPRIRRSQYKGVFDCVRAR